MENTFEIFKGDSEAHREPTPASAEAYARFIIKCAPRSMTERLDVARQFGWETDEVTDTIFFREYQKERAIILFPHLADKIRKSWNTLIIPEVDKAEENFTVLTGLALKKPSLSLDELSSFLTELSSAATKVDVSLANMTEQEQELQQ